MILYHYAPKNNTIKKDGYLSISKIDRDLKPYIHRAGSDNKDDILKWLDSTFYGRSRSISCLTEKIKWRGNDPVLKNIIKRSELFYFELDDLLKNGIVEAIWCKDGSDYKGCNENLYQVTPDKIDLTPLSWKKVDISKGQLYSVVRHYMIVLKDGCIPAKYMKKYRFFHLK
jgi:hypothetical protein